MSEVRQTVPGAYAAIEAHEKICAERYDAINFKIGLIFKVFAWGLPLAAALLLALAGWAINRLFENQAEQLRELRAVKAEVSSMPPGGA